MKTVKELTDFLFDVVVGKEAIPYNSDEEAKEFDERGYDIFCNEGNDIAIAKTSKLANLNILDKNVNFKVFEKLPKIWSVYQNATEISTYR